MLTSKTALFVSLLSFLFIIESATAQQFTLKGKVMGQDNVPVEFVQASLLKEDSSIVYQSVTDSLGIFVLKVDSGNYTLLIDQFGQEFLRREIHLSQDMDLGVLEVDESKMLESVDITVKKKLVERKVDRLVFNVESSVLATGGDARDVLKITPGVRLKDDEIKLAGKSTVRVMINDKIVQLSGEELQNYLKAIPSSNIQKIEVITNPPAKYEAEGNSGLINIQLKEVQEDNWSTTLRSTYRQATYETLSHGVGFSYKKNKVTTLADVSYGYGKRLYTNDINYYYPEEHWNVKMFNKNHWKYWNTLLNLQYDLNSKSNIGIQYTGFFSDNSTNEYNDNYSYDQQNSNLFKYNKTVGLSEAKPQSVSFNVNYNLKLDDQGKKITADADYFNTRSPKDNHFNSVLSNYQENLIEEQFAINDSDQDIKNYSIKADLELPYSWANLSLGAKVSATNTVNLVEANFYNTDDNTIISSQNDHFKYRENIQAIYFSATKSFGEKWESKIGLRGENTQTRANSISEDQVTNREYFKVFPTVYLSYKADEDKSFSMNFGRRIGRPGFWELNPARWYTSPQSYSTGNPFLQPSFIYSYEFNYSFRSLLNFNLSYSSIEDASTQVTYHDVSQNTQIFRRLNYADAKYMGGNLTLTLKPFNWWESSTDFSASYGELNPYIDILGDKYSGWEGYASTMNTLTLNDSKSFFATVYYLYNFRSTTGYGTASSSSTLDIGFKYLMLSEKLTIALNFEDIFKDNITIYKDSSSDILQTFNQYYDTRAVRFSLNYKFGNKKVAVSQRKTGNQEERGRSN